MKIVTQDLQEAFKVVDQVDTQPGLASSQFLRLEASDTELKLSLTGLCVGYVTCPVEEGKDWMWYIDRRVVSAFLASAKSKAITVDHKDNALLWKSGRQRITSTAMDAVTGYANWVPSGNKLALTATLRKELALHAQYAPQTAAADHLSAVCLCKGYGVLASDSFVVATCLDKTQPTSLKLPVLLTSLMGNGAAVLVDKNGAGIQYSNGYLYQPLATNCVTGYPLKKIAQVVTERSGLKPLLKVKARSFFDTLTHLKNYVFGSITDLLVTCTASKTPGHVNLTLDVISGQAQTAMEADYATEFKLSWNLGKLLPWAEHIASLDGDTVVSCGQKDGCYVFSARIGKPLRMLVIAETV